MYKHLYVNGDSMSMGAELYDAEDPHEVKLDKLRDGAWPKVVADHYGVNWTNKAISGGSNDRILRTTFDWVTHYIEQGNDPSELFVIIGVSEMNRSEILTHEDKLIYSRLSGTAYKSVLTGNKVIVFPAYEDSGLDDQDIRGEICGEIYGAPPEPMQTHLNRYLHGYLMASSHEHRIQKHLKFLHYMELFFESMGIGYLFFQSVGYDHFMDVNDTLRTTMSSRFSKEVSDQVYNGRLMYDLEYNMQQFCKENKVAFGSGDHPLHDGHQLWGNEIVKCLEESGLWVK